MRITAFWLLGFMLVAPLAWPQSYPGKPVRVIVQYPPGGTPDTYGRIVSAELASSDIS